VDGSEFRRGEPPSGSLLSVPVEASWDAFDPTAGLSDASVAVDCGPGAGTETAVPGAAAPGTATPWTTAISLRTDTRCEVTVIGRDGVGNETTVVTLIEAAIVPVAEGGLASAEVTGDQVGIVARRGPDLGRAAVYLDGEAVGLVDLYHPTATAPEIVYVADLAPDAESTISVEATGTSDPAATGNAVLIDAFVTVGATA
jgi:hypothetical protein